MDDVASGDPIQRESLRDAIQLIFCRSSQTQYDFITYPQPFLEIQGGWFSKRGPFGRYRYIELWP